MFDTMGILYITLLLRLVTFELKMDKETKQRTNNFLKNSKCNIN